MAAVLFALGLAVIGYGASVPGTLSTILITLGILLALLAIPVYYIRRPATARPSQTIEESPAGGDLIVHPSPTGPDAKPGPPHLKFRDPIMPEGLALKWPPEWPGSKIRPLVIPVANDPPPGVQAEDAEHVCAYLTIQLPDGSKPVDRAQARWADKAQPGQRSSYTPVGSPEVREINLPANGADFGVDTIIYLRNEHEIRPYTEGGPQGRIKASQFEIELRVRGINVDETRRYRVERTPDNPYEGFAVFSLQSSEAERAALPTAPPSDTRKALAEQGLIALIDQGDRMATARRFVRWGEMHAYWVGCQAFIRTAFGEVEVTIFRAEPEGDDYGEMTRDMTKRLRTLLATMNTKHVRGATRTNCELLSGTLSRFQRT
ncbi:MAG: hypothetical protein ACRDMH_01435 [Solirubrobacterales bacterium]